MRKFVQAAILLAAVVGAHRRRGSILANSRNERRAPSHPCAVVPFRTVATSERASDALLTSIVTWLSTNFDLATDDAASDGSSTPPPPRLTQRRNRAFLGAGGPVRSRRPMTGPATVAIYDRQRGDDLPSARLDRKDAGGTLRAGPRDGSSPAERRPDEIRVPAGARAIGLCRATAMARPVRAYTGRRIPDRSVHAAGDDPLHALTATQRAPGSRSGRSLRKPGISPA